LSVDSSETPLPFCGEKYFPALDLVIQALEANSDWRIDLRAEGPDKLGVFGAWPQPPLDGSSPAGGVGTKLNEVLDHRSGL
jgi:hypothetical protein